MKTIETTVYSLAELKEQFPESYAKAFEHFQDRQRRSGYIPWQDEIMDSLKAIVDACGFTMKNWSLGDSSNRSQNITLADSGYDFRLILSGRRALACFARVLMKHSYARPTFPGWSMEFPGVCGFTGYCADEDFSQAIWSALRSGDTLKDAIEGLASEYGRMIDNELEQMCSEEEFQTLNEDSNFTEDGDEF